MLRQVIYPLSHSTSPLEALEQQWLQKLISRGQDRSGCFFAWGCVIVRSTLCWLLLLPPK
jgi:hypothetical protein